MSDSHLSHSFEPVRLIAALFDAFPHPWFVAGGWAIDLFLGTLTRLHEDIELIVLRESQEMLQMHLSGWELRKVDSPGIPEESPWKAGEWLNSPQSRIRALQVGGNLPGFEVILADTADGLWRFYRDPAITHSLEDIGARSTIGGIPYFAPEVILLWKAMYHRPKDEHDFRQALPWLDRTQRAWLRNALQAHRPADPWLEWLSERG